MTEIDTLQDTLRRTARRHRLMGAWRGFWAGLLSGTSVYLVALAAFKLLPIPAGAVDFGLWLGLACVPVGALWGGRRRVTPSEAARLLDARAGLKERLGTALEVSHSEKAGLWRNLVIHDALGAAARLEPRRLLPLRLPAFTRWTVVVLAVAAGVGFVPEYRSAARRQSALDQAVIEDVGRNLVQVTKRELARRVPAEAPVREAVEGMGDLGERLQTAKLTRDDALRDLAKATESLKEQALELARNPALRRLEQAARNSGSSSSQTSEALQRRIESLQRALGDKAPSEDAARELQRELKSMQQEARGMAGQEGAAGQAAREQMAQAVSELARKAEAMGLPMESLDEALAALAQADVEQFLKDLDLASQDLERMADMARTLAQLQQQAERQGRDLGEQLQNGQAQAAAETLRKMIDQLQKSGLTPEQLAEMAREVAKGAEAGQNYGEVGDLLKKAAERLGKGESAAGAAQLASAREELERLMEQMGDAQSLMAAMQALQKAQLCVGNGQCWGTKPGGNRIGLGKGGKGGRGVGTWSENDAWAMPDSIQDLWDNSGLNRPDMAGKGHTDRDAATPDGLTPTKIKGQIQPGGPMPSISLRGVSIKGQSRVAFTEAVAAAQSDAQSALNQEQVPKAYQNAVRDYFDDLK